MFAKRLFDYYPGQEAGNPEVVLAGTAEVFVHYAQLYGWQLVERAVSPVYGLPKAHPKFMPRVGEVTEWLEKDTAHLVKTPPPVLALPEPETRREARPTYEELQRRCAEAGLFIGDNKTTAKPFDVAAFKKKMGISDDQWNAIPGRG